jgi:hypothetical protein
MGQSTSKRLPPFEVDPRLLLPPHGGMAWREFVQQRMMAVMAARAGASAGGMQMSHTLPQHAVHTRGVAFWSSLGTQQGGSGLFSCVRARIVLFLPCRARGEERLVAHPCRFHFAKKLNQPHE